MTPLHRASKSATWLVLVAVACAPKTATPSAPDDPATILAEVSDQMWQRILDQSPLVRLREGLEVEHLPDLSEAAALRHVEVARTLLDRISRIDAESLDHATWIDLETLRFSLETEIEGQPFFWHESVLTSYSSPLPLLREVFGALDLSTEQQAASYLELLDQVPAFVGSIEDLARGQLARGIVVSQANLPAVLGLVRAQIAAPERGPFAIGEARTAELEAGARQRLVAAVEKTVDERINPALERLLGFLEGEYSARAPAGVGASQYPGGEGFYRFATRRATTLDITPEEVHEIGLEMVAELESAMDLAQAEAGFAGGREEFRAFLRSDPRFFPTTADEVGERLERAAAAMESRVPELFASRPEAPYGAERLDPSLEGSQTYGYYDMPSPKEPRGVYYYNGSALDQRSWIGLEAISLHELVPGHHFQIARQLENESLSKLRRNTLHTAYTEGWGSYGSHLGVEAGLYQDPYSRYGMYGLEVFLATRLVVDPGMNLLGWSLEDGRSYMRQHTLESETQIATESLRYSTDMPAQAVGYQMGKRKLLELRKRAETALGDRFDPRAFHEAVLEHGSLPLRVLERHIDHFISEQQSKRRETSP